LSFNTHYETNQLPAIQINSADSIAEDASDRVDAVKNGGGKTNDQAKTTQCAQRKGGLPVRTVFWVPQCSILWDAFQIKKGQLKNKYFYY